MIRYLSILLLITLTACSAPATRDSAEVLGNATAPRGYTAIQTDCIGVLKGKESTHGMTIERCRALWPNL